MHFRTGQSLCNGAVVAEFLHTLLNLGPNPGMSQYVSALFPVYWISRLLVNHPVGM
jgi:hypothetical protein